MFRHGMLKQILAAALVAAAATAQDGPDEVVGDFPWPETWVVFAPAGHMAPPLNREQRERMPGTLTVGDRALEAQEVRPTGGQFDFGPLFGSMTERQTAYVFVPLDVPEAMTATIGFGADWWMQAWLNGEPILDTTEAGNGSWPPSVRDHRITVRLEAGRNVLAVCFLSGTGSSILALGGPRELRGPEHVSIMSADADVQRARLAARWEGQEREPRPTPGWAPAFLRAEEEPERERIALHVDWADNLLEEIPVTFGVPFPRGALPDSARLRLMDGEGRTVPAEMQTAATWEGPDGSARWVRMHARFRRGESYAIEFGRAVRPEPSQGLEVIEDERTVTVSTGPMRFTIARDRPTLVESALLDPSGRFEPGDVVVDPEQAAAALPSVMDGEGIVYTASAEGLKVDVVERGPMRAAVRREGWYTSAEGRRFCGFVTYTYFYAGDSGFRHDHTLIVAFDTQREMIRDVALPVPLRMVGERRAWFATDGSPGGEPWERAADGVALSLVEHYREGWTLWENGEAAAAGRRSGGWFGLADAHRGAAIGVEHFWQNSPAELAVSDQGMVVHLYASHGSEPLDFRPSSILGVRGEEYPGARVFHARWYRDGLDEMTQGFGTAKTHSVHVQFFAAPDRVSAARRVRTVAAPVIAFADPAWACRTEAFGRVHPYDPDRFPDLEAILDAIVHRRLWLREHLQNYGWFHFGDVNGNLANPGDPERVTFHHWRRWASMFYGNPNVMPLLFMRSGRRDAWDFHRVNTRHIADIDICHLDHADWGKWRGGRYGGNGGIVHFAADLYDLGCDTHLRFLLYDYYLNGNLRTWEVANMYMEAQAALRSRPANLRYQHRHTGGPLRFFTEAYQATWEPEYLDAMRQFARILYEAKEELGVTRYCDVYMNEGKVFYYQATGDERMRDLFLSDMRILRRRRDAHVFTDTRSTTLYGMSHAFWMTGDRGFLPFALWQLDVARKGTVVEGDPGRIGAIDWALEYAYNATLGNQLPTIMAALVDAGEPLPRAEGPTSFETSGAFRFLREDGAPLEIAVRTKVYTGTARPFTNWRSWVARLPEREQPGLELVGPGGEVLERIFLGRDAESSGSDAEARAPGMQVPSDVVVFRQPPGGAAGIYTVQPVSSAVPMLMSLHATSTDRWGVDAGDARLSGEPFVPYYFTVPRGTRLFSIRLRPAAVRGEFRVEVLDAAGQPRGETVLAGGGRGWNEIRLDAGAPEGDEAWQLQVFPRVEFFVHFEGVPGLLATSADALFEPERPWSAPDLAPLVEGGVPQHTPDGGPDGGAVASLPPRAELRLAAPGPGGADVNPAEGTLELWVHCHRRSADVQDRTVALFGDLRLYRRAGIGTYVNIGNQGHQSGFIIPPGRWVHLAVTWTPHRDGGTELALYADGIYVAGPFSRRVSAAGIGRADAVVIPSGESGLSLAGLRVSDHVRYAGDFVPPTPAVLLPGEGTVMAWPSDQATERP